MSSNPFRAFELLGPLFLGIFLCVLLVGIVLQIFYLLTLQRTMELVHPQLRKMSPGQVWMVFIPIFGLIWNFMMVGYIADSLRDEFRARNVRVDEERPGYSVGLWMCILPLTGFLPFIGFFGSIAGLVCWIVFWTKMSGYKRLLEQTKMNPPNPFMQQPTF
ncbi:MAG TPA: hypothetical protein VL651_06465 [Bacteroidia bacterium]|jgi:hypothetical protein|nr:hypothetical protein [Bacteroidia bacterium]